jgi:dTDP-4-dehydrorhamnose 3,5-epimerase
LNSEYPLQLTNLGIEGAYKIHSAKAKDARGYFSTMWSQEFAAKASMKAPENLYKSFTLDQGTIRGLHYQVAPFEEQKFVFCSSGRAFDVVIDLRKNSKSYLKWASIELSSELSESIYVPAGCAHGFQALTSNTTMIYLSTAVYSPSAQRGIRYNDPTFSISWPLAVSKISDYDKNISDYEENL